MFSAPFLASGGPAAFALRAPMKRHIV